MPREQEPARNPLRPFQSNTQNSQRTIEKTQTQRSTSPGATESRAIPENISSPQPLFGVPTTLGASPQPFARHQPLQHHANMGATRQGTGGRQDQYSSLFIAPKNSAQRADLHKPKPGFNPLSQLHKPPGPAITLNTHDGQRSLNTSHQPNTNIPAVRKLEPGSRRINIDDDDDVFEIAKPAQFQSWQPKPIVYPTFSSQQNTSSSYRPKSNLVDFFTLDVGMATNASLWDDQAGRSDPNTYIDPAKANEQLKLLFEGAVDDDEDKPKTKKKKKQQDKKIDELTDQIKGMSVQLDGEANTESTKQIEEEEADSGEEEDFTIEGLKVNLLPHQIQGVKWMKAKELGKKDGRGQTKGGILADDMGLGKTIQSIALMLSNPKPIIDQSKLDEMTQKQKQSVNSDRGTLIVAPLALIKQWEAEIKDRVEEKHALKVCVHHGPKRTKSYKDLRKYDIVITTYSTLAVEHAASKPELLVGCFGIKWYRIILDEAHSIKNRNAKSTKAACTLRSIYRWCLTGTPMQNNLEELQSLIHFLKIAPMDNLDYWREYITRPMSNGQGGLAIERLRIVLTNLMKRRTKDVLKQSGALNNGVNGTDGKATSEFKIVKRTVENVQVKFSEQERSFYDRLVSRTDQRLEKMMAGSKMSYASALVLLMRLRQACNHPKLIGSDLMAEKDALVENGTQTPRKKASQVPDAADDLAALLGGLTVEMKLCDVCQAELSKLEVKDGALRCKDCESDLAEQEALGRKKQNRKKDRISIVKSDRRVKRHVIIDSDDEDESEEQKKTVNLTSDDEENEEESSEEEEDDDDDYESDEVSAAGLVASTKIRHLLNILRTDSHKHKYIVFSVFTSMLDLIDPFLHQSHIKFVRYDGSMRNDMREAALNSLRTDPTVRVLLCSLRAGSLGLNLTAASRVVVLEPFWNPFVEEQAIDRVHRLNQTQDVVVYKMTIKDTVEARILELQEQKRALAAATIEGGATGKVGKLSMQEMLKLFDHRAESSAKVDMIGFQDQKGILARGESTEYNGGRNAMNYEREERRRDSDRTSQRDRERERIKKDRPKVPDVYARRW